MDLSVVILEDDPRYRHSLEMLFSNTRGFRLGASFGSAHAMLQELETRERAGQDPSWQLALVDIELPGMNGIEATRRLKKHLPALTVVMLTVFEDPTVILEAITAGADGYLLKKTSAPELLSQLKAIASGGSPLTPDVARTVLSLLRERTPKRISGQFFRTGLAHQTRPNRTRTRSAANVGERSLLQASRLTTQHQHRHSAHSHSRRVSQAASPQRRRSRRPRHSRKAGLNPTSHHHAIADDLCSRYSANHDVRLSGGDPR